MNESTSCNSLAGLQAARPQNAGDAGAVAAGPMLRAQTPQTRRRSDGPRDGRSDDRDNRSEPLRCGGHGCQPAMGGIGPRGHTCHGL